MLIKGVSILASNQFYKIYQLADILVSKYSYIQISLNKFQEFKEKEIWFANSNNPHYQLIRVSFFEAEQFIFDSSRVNEYIQYLSAYAKKPIRFLDIHITNSSYNIEFEPFDYLNLEENYNSGKDVSEYYPEIYHAVHNVDNEEIEITDYSDGDSAVSCLLIYAREKQEEFRQQELRFDEY